MRAIDKDIYVRYLFILLHSHERCHVRISKKVCTAIWCVVVKKMQKYSNSFRERLGWNVRIREAMQVWCDDELNVMMKTIMTMMMMLLQRWVEVRWFFTRNTHSHIAILILTCASFIKIIKKLRILIIRGSYTICLVYGYFTRYQNDIQQQSCTLRKSRTMNQRDQPGNKMKTANSSTSKCKMMISRMLKIHDEIIPLPIPTQNLHSAIFLIMAFGVFCQHKGNEEAALEWGKL